jgi:hypothetical protein
LLTLSVTAVMYTVGLGDVISMEELLLTLSITVRCNVHILWV